MPRITKELLRSRSEHNEMCLSTLEEITLHQFELEKIELLDVYCRHLKILYLQNNIIEKMENLNKLKELEYLNLALNNISKIEGIEGCESLKKLDFTVNFIDLENLEESMINLSKCPQIKELYMTGNPSTDWVGYRPFTIATVPQLQTLDGKEITPAEKIQANQIYDDLLVDLNYQIEMKAIKKKQEQEEQKKQKQEENQNENKENIDDKDQKQPYNVETRRKMYLDLAADKEKHDREKYPEKYKDKTKPVSSMFKPDGDIRQCNEGKYKFSLREWDDPEYSFFIIEVPKFMDTSFIDVNLNPCWISVRIKGKLLQLKLNEEIQVEKSDIKRSQLTGFLEIKMLKMKFNQALKAQQEKQKTEKSKIEDEKKQKIKLEEEERIKRLKLCDKIEQKAIQKQQDYITFDKIPDLE
ncbi:leucine rich repeat protein [Ichthyophthirius multifiliis]|uniref:Leucine rich repeat protein n=1 Tax=Ichthyophthirius multifiliis TaxID=5932 RepID=G0QT74_ICHMU|nr:leucine rich repeat protein [Ichthyophthirius multifiliis]EGR31599.1 leucine rich repeat protein [Ichthyophthirius multifiliis]|eukprot:XP_004035085.1 leucine rich repeat protein [Ichthyophthirius multifiliis]